MIPLGAIRDRLAADPVIAATATGGVHDHDVRRTGFASAPGAIDEHGDVRPLIALDDAGETRTLGGGHAVALLQLVLIGPDTAEGRAALATLADRGRALLHGWHHYPSGTAYSYAGRLGQQTDERGVIDRVQIQIGRALVPEARQ